MNAWITGSSSGLGKKIADIIESRNVNVIRHSKKDGDLSDRGVVQDIVKYLPEIDILVCCVGQKAECNALSDIDILKKMMDVNLYSMVMCCQEVSVGMIKRRNGKIITIGSVDGCFGQKNGAMYSVSKAALHFYTRCLSNQLKDYGISVNCVAPGTLWSEQISEEVAKIVSFLAIDNNYISGQVIRADDKHTFPC